ncbi:peptidoglycan DD-metalloendopeptidase family protein [Roseisalinus antarcticus]|nr:peptidoglycan DD-metalloendopeptidase family protein [Roseisalinus antarcticus]
MTSVLALAACKDGRVDLDMRGMGNAFDTSAAAADVPARPQPDARGVISYPNNQVVLARRGETVDSIAARLGLNPAELARFNGIEPGTPLRPNELIALPSRIADGAGPGTAAQPGTGGIDVTELASAAIDRAGPQGTTSPPPTTAPAPGPEPLRHTVRRGETVYSISRLYGVPVRAIAEWNGLGPDLSIREGQQLMVPQAGGAAAAPASSGPPIPGAGSPTPLPPSASAPLPDETPTPAAVEPEAPDTPDLGSDRTAEASNARLAYPVQGSIIRAYSRGRNEGIDISAPAGTAVKAAAAGTVAAITQDTDGASIIVVRHPDNLLTVYVNITDIAVAKDQQVTQGQTLARVPAGDPSYLHFETREGLQSVDPTGLLP